MKNEALCRCSAAIAACSVIQILVKGKLISDDLEEFSDHLVIAFPVFGLIEYQ
jgi:hypothetical protein